MNITICGGKTAGSVHAPRSKSAMQRACALALIKKGKTNIISPGTSNDDKAALDIIQSLGARVERVQGKDELSIISEGVLAKNNKIFCGESGLSIRMFTPIIATLNEKIWIDGEGSLRSRPMDFFYEVLPQLGVKVETNGGKLPLSVQGALIPKNIEVSGQLSSQYITGLLIAFASLHTENVVIRVKDLKSKPYIDLTLSMMQHFGYQVENKDFKTFTFTAETYTPKLQRPTICEIEGDWSGGAFLIVAGAIAGDIEVLGLDANSTQADRAILEVLDKARVNYHWSSASCLRINKSIIHPFDFDATDRPDLFPPLAALAAHAKGKSIIKGVSRLKHKESNRSLTLQIEFAKLGIPISLNDDNMIIEGGNALRPATLHSCDDHRIAMAGAVVILPSNQSYTIEHAEAVNKSYPLFYEDLAKLGIHITR